MATAKTEVKKGLTKIGLVPAPQGGGLSGIAIVGEPLFADTADAVLSRNLAIQQLPHLPVRAQLAVSAGMMPDRRPGGLPSDRFAPF